MEEDPGEKMTYGNDGTSKIAQDAVYSDWGTNQRCDKAGGRLRDPKSRACDLWERITRIRLFIVSLIIVIQFKRREVEIMLVGL